MNRSPSESGNVFFLIFAAIAMFAALAWAFTQNSRQSSSALTAEQSRLAAQEIISITDMYAQAVQALRLRGCTERQLSFVSANTTGWLTNPLAPADKSCHLFDLNGGKVTDTQIQKKWLLQDPDDNYWWFNGEVPVEGVGTAAPELLAMASGLYPDICNALNQIVMGKDMTYESIGSATTGFTGTYPPALADGFGDDPGSIYNGKTSGCMDVGGDYYVYYVVLLAR